MSVRHSLNARTQIEALAIFVHLSVYMDSSVCLYVQADDGLSALFTFHDLANGFEVLGSYVPRYATYFKREGEICQQANRSLYMLMVCTRYYVGILLLFIRRCQTHLRVSKQTNKANQLRS